MLLNQIPGYFKARRDALSKAYPSALFVLPAATEYLRNPDVHHPFRQESNFYYLSGFEEPESYLVLVPSKSGPGHRMVLFVRHRDPEKEIWEGARYGVEGAQSVFGADEAYPIEELDRRLPELIQGADRMFYRIGQNEVLDRRILAALETHRRSQGRSGRSMMAIADPNEALGEMRLFKSPEEVALLRRACEISALAHKAAMQECKPGMKEYEIEALLQYVMRKNGCGRLGYGSIVAGGKNATCLHYRFNNDELRDETLLLIDAGGEHEYLCADITRTFPVGREFTKSQAKIYDLVLSAQKECIAMAKPGAKLPEIHRHAVNRMAEGIVSLGFVKGGKSAVEELVKTGAFKRFYPHGTSHWLGMDVHDVGLYMRDGQPRQLEPGMVFTIEPGFYVQPGDRDVPAEYREIGIRIEDDVLITRDGCDVLTRDAPKERAELEALRR